MGTTGCLEKVTCSKSMRRTVEIGSSYTFLLSFKDTLTTPEESSQNLPSAYSYSTALSPSRTLFTPVSPVFHPPVGTPLRRSQL